MSFHSSAPTVRCTPFPPACCGSLCYLRQRPCLEFPPLSRTLHQSLHLRALEAGNRCLQHLSTMIPPTSLTATLKTLIPLMAQLRMEDSMSGDNRPRRLATPHSIANGLGPRGSVVVPIGIWNTFSLPHAIPALASTQLPHASRDGHALMLSLLRDGYCDRLPPQPGMPVVTLYNARTFNEQWCKTPSFSLPSFSRLLTALATK